MKRTLLQALYALGRSRRIRDPPLSFKPYLYVLYTHGIRCGEANDSVKLDGLSFMLIAVEDNEPCVGSVTKVSCAVKPVNYAVAYTISNTGFWRGV